MIGNIISEIDLIEEEKEPYNVVNALDFISDSCHKKCLGVNEFLDGLRSILSEIGGLNEQEKEFFINKMAKFQQLFTPKCLSADTEPYQFRVKPHQTIIRKTYLVPFKY